MAHGVNVVYICIYKYELFEHFPTEGRLYIYIHIDVERLYFNIYIYIYIYPWELFYIQCWELGDIYICKYIQYIYII